MITGCVLTLLNCGDRNAPRQQTTFTRLDSLTDYYLGLQDSMLQAWNIMIHDDNQKIKAMHNLLHELTVSASADPEQLEAYSERLEQLLRLRYTQKTMANADVVEEYDFASNSLVTELIAAAESQPQFQYNSTLQKLADEIRMADQRVYIYRDDYDAIVATYNKFLEENREDIREIDIQPAIDKRPLFQMVADEKD
jgi:hypothetical protein